MLDYVSLEEQAKLAEKAGLVLLTHVCPGCDGDGAVYHTGLLGSDELGRCHCTEPGQRPPDEVTDYSPAALLMAVVLATKEGYELRLGAYMLRLYSEDTDRDVAYSHQGTDAGIARAALVAYEQIKQP